MADQPDKDSKTEEPTEKKVADAIEKGNVPRSREVSMFASLLGMLAAAGFLVGPGTASFFSQMVLLLDKPAGYPLSNGHEAGQLMWALTLEAGRFLIPVTMVLAVAGLAASFFEHAPNFAVEQIKPKWSRVSLIGGWKRVFGQQSLVEFLKALFKFGAIAAVCVVVLNAERDSIVNAILGDPGELPVIALSLAVRLVSAACVTIALLVVADMLWTRYRWRAELRMTRQELKDEMKQSDGDPLVKGRLRSLARDRARRRMIAEVPAATVVIANPTHYAIALKYDRAGGGAPLVVAKGIDLIAMSIRDVAERHNVPVVEDKPLARAMYDAVEVGGWIPEEFYRAVAKILHYLYAGEIHAAAR